MITFKILSNCERVKSFLKSLGADTLAAPGFQETFYINFILIVVLYKVGPK